MRIAQGVKPCCMLKLMFNDYHGPNGGVSHSGLFLIRRFVHMGVLRLKVNKDCLCVGVSGGGLVCYLKV